MHAYMLLRACHWCDRNLWDEEEKHSLAEMAKDTHNREGHSSKIAKCVSHKNAWRVAVVVKQYRADGDEREDKVQREKMVFFTAVEK